MKIASSIEQYFDDEGRPLVNGRVTFYDHDSDTPAEIFYLVGNDYTAAPNPQFTADDGRIPTVFFEASVKDVKVEKQLPDGSYALLDTFEVGFDFPKAANATILYGMDELRDLNTEVGIVQVVGYYDKYDCPVRWYVWDPNCSLDADAGVIVESNTGVEGRWILFYDDELLPSSFYGIKPGENETNLSGFTSYPDFVGTYKIRTPKMPRFLSGTYTTDGSIHTPKTLYFDDGATFPTCDFQCAAAVIPHNSTYVSEFYFTSDNVEAHSSWFRTAQQFLTCGADVLVVDKTNYIIDYRINLPCSIANKTLMYTVNQRLPLTYVNNGRLDLSRTTLIGTNIFNSSDVIRFSYTEIRDEWWSNPSDIDWVNKVRARTVMLDTILLANFKSVPAYVAAQKADNATVLDLAGRSISSLAITADDSVVELRNVRCTSSLSVSKGTTAEVTFRNVVTPSLSASCRYLTTYSSDISFNNEPSILAAWFHESRVNSSVAWTTSKQVIADDSWLGINFKYATDNVTDHAVLSFTDCRFQTNVLFEVKRIDMTRCITSNNTIRIYPHKSDDHYVLSCYFDSCTFNNNLPIEFTKFEDDNVYDVYFSPVTFTNNSFINQGIKCRYWQHRVGNNYNKRFIARTLYNPSVNPDDMHHTYLYSGNWGNCPKENFEKFGANKDNFTTNSQWPSWKTCDTAYESVWPPLNQSVGDSPFCWGYLGEVSPNIYSYDVDNGGHIGAMYPAPAMYAAFYNVDNNDPANDGDLFKQGLGWGSASLEWDALKEFIQAK